MGVASVHAVVSIAAAPTAAKLAAFTLTRVLRVAQSHSNGDASKSDYSSSTVQMPWKSSLLSLIARMRNVRPGREERVAVAPLRGGGYELRRVGW